MGVDNWLQIADSMETKNAEQCETHYYTVYYKNGREKCPKNTDVLINRDHNGKIYIDKGKEKEIIQKKQIYLKNKPLIFNDEEVKEEPKNDIVPPKCIIILFLQIKIDGLDIQNADLILGYMPRRGDFTIEYDNEAEKLLAEMEFFDDDDDNEKHIKEEVLKLYNSRLDERIKRKKFVIEKHLLEPKKPPKGDREKIKEEKEIYSLMKPFMRFCEGNEFNELVEGLIQERNLKKELDEMRLYRALGLSKLEQIDKYLERKPVKNLDSSSISLSAGPKKTTSAKKKSSHKGSHKKSIETIQNLSPEEKKLCEELKISEDDYNEVKNQIQKAIIERKDFRRETIPTLFFRKIKPELAIIIYDFMVRNQLLNQPENAQSESISVEYSEDQSRKY